MKFYGTVQAIENITGQGSSAVALITNNSMDAQHKQVISDFKFSPTATEFAIESTQTLRGFHNPYEYIYVKNKKI